MEYLVGLLGALDETANTGQKHQEVKYICDTNSQHHFQNLMFITHFGAGVEEINPAELGQRQSTKKHT